jgi:cytochrome b involved in lipid metabolism
LVKRLFFNF